MAFECAASVDDARNVLSVSRLQDIPQRLCEIMGGEICVIWKPSRTLIESCGTAGEKRGRLYPYSSNFETKKAIQHAGVRLAIAHDTTGRFYVSSARSHYENDFHSKDQHSPSRELMKKLTKVCLARFNMQGPGDGDFVVSIYRGRQGNDFTPAEAEKLEQIASLLCIAYERIIASQLKQAIVTVNDILRPQCRDTTAAKVPFEKLCAAMSKYFHMHEVSIYMTDSVPVTSSAKYLLRATTEAAEGCAKSEYIANVSDGLTGYTLARSDDDGAVWFHDLHNFEFEESRHLIQTRYPGAHWRDSAEFARRTRIMYDLSEKDLSPPLPFAAVQIKSEGKAVFGVLRTSFGVNPFHFLPEQIDALKIIAKEIGRWWERIIEQDRRAEIWGALNHTLEKQHQTLKSTDHTDRLIEASVESIVMERGFDLAVFRQARTDGTVTVTAIQRSRRGAALAPGISRGDRIALCENFVPPAKNRSFFVQQKERTTEDYPPSPEKTLFVGAKIILTSAVFIKSRLYGVLDIAFLDARDYFPEHDRIKEYILLVLQQFALFARIAQSIKDQANTYDVFTHQIHTPLFNAAERIGQLTDDLGHWNEGKASTLIRIAGMIRKARSVAGMIRTFGKLVSEGRITDAHREQTSAERARKLCLEVASNTKLLDSRMKLDFDLCPMDARAPEKHWGNSSLVWDPEYAEQCLDAVINNAFKYSAMNGRIQISCVISNGYFKIRVRNRGPFVIAAEEIETFKLPFERGSQARDRSGQGIGLWITDKLMEAQGGILEIVPTNYFGETEITLAFKSH